MNIPETLIDKIFNKKCILFLGAGATLNSGGVLGDELAKYLYDQLGNTGVAYNRDLARFTYNLVRKGYRIDIEEIIRKRFKSCTPNDHFKKISNIPWKAIYTTNYDDLIEKSYHGQRYYEYTLENPIKPKSHLNNTQIPLYKINGNINTPYTEDNPLIITLEDLKIAKKNYQTYINRLVDDLNDTFIFIGYSFNDDIISNILDNFSNNRRWESIKEKYIILPNISEDLESDLEIYKINYIKGTADDFFDQIDKETKENYQLKLKQLKLTFDSSSFFSKFDSRTLNHISECLEFYNSNCQYPVDPSYFYKGGSPSWGIIKNNLDVSLQLEIKDSNEKTESMNTTELIDFLDKKIQTSEFKMLKILIKGAAVSGKTTLVHRLAYELIEKGIATFIFKSQSEYTSGLLYHIYRAIEAPLVLIFDNLIVDFDEIFNMITDIQKNNIPVIFILTSRYSDWENVISNYNKTRLNPIDYNIDIKDKLIADEAKKLVSLLNKNKLINVSTNYEINSIIKKISCSNNNLMDILFEVIDRSNSITDSICDEYDNLSKEAQTAYGIVSLSYKYGLKLKWGILKRAIEERFNFTWNDFVNKILKGDAKGNLFDEEIQGEYYISGRHRYISELILKIHYRGNYAEEISDLKNLIEASKGNSYEEYFLGGLINSILKNDIDYSNEQIENLLNYAIDEFIYEENKAFINHLKGEYLLSKQKISEAITCFDANVQNNLNKMYSLHSIGKAYFYLAKKESINSGKFINYINYAKKYLYEGIELFSKNEYYYSMLLIIFEYLKNNNCLSETDLRNMVDLEKLATKNLNINNINELNKSLKDIM